MARIKRVVLYKHGVGFFESAHEVDADAEVRLHFKVEEMNDVLKSLTVHDPSGTVISVSYDSHKPVSKLLEEIAIELPASGGTTAILARLRGAQVRVATHSRQIEGSILGLDQRPIAAPQHGGVIQETLLSLYVQGGTLTNIPLGEIQTVELQDPALQADLGYCLDTLLRSYKRNTKQLSIFTRGEGTRELQISYLVEAPAWKSSYRIQLPEAPDAPVFWEGWALVDNPRDEDWEDVELTLVAGLPVAFRHDLYSPRYVTRPEIHVQRESTVGPVVTAPALRAPSAAPFAGGGGADPFASAPDPWASGADPFASAAEPFADMADPFAAAAPSYDAFAAPAFATAPEAARQRASEVIAQSVGEMFQYRLRHPVTVKRNQSALVPIVGHEAEAQKVVFYNQQQRAQNPFAAVDLTNTTGLTLEGGPLLVVEGGSYAGEAMLDTLKPDDRRIVPYAVDLAVLVNTTSSFNSRPVHQVKVVNGQLHILHAVLQMQSYDFYNNDEREKICCLEHPLQHGWDLHDTPAEEERTATHYRFRFPLPPRQRTDFVVTTRRIDLNVYTLSNTSIDMLQSYISYGWFREKSAAVERLIELQRELATCRITLAEVQRRGTEQTKEVERCQQGLAKLGTSTDEQRLRHRYVQQIEAAENQLPELRAEAQRLQAEVLRLDKELTSAAGAIELDLQL